MMDSYAIIYDNFSIAIERSEDGMKKIIFNDSVVIYEHIFNWRKFSNYLINAKDNLLSCVVMTPYDEPLSGLTATSIDLKTNFLRGIATIIVLQRLIVTKKYLRISSLAENYDIFTYNQLKALRTALIFHLKTVADDRFLKHVLDFVNRWSFLFIRGDKVDKLELLTELIVRYFTKQERENIVEDIPNTLENRVRRIEGILGIRL